MTSPESATNRSPQAPDSSGAKVAFMITKRMEQALLAQGIDQKKIDSMKPEEAHALLNAQKGGSESVERIPVAKNPIVSALESAGVRLRTRQNEIRREIGKCELALLALISDAPKDDRGDVASGAKKQLEQDFSYAIRESEKRILQLINKSRQVEPLTQVPAAIADKLGRFSKTEEEVAELVRVREEILKLLERATPADSNSGAPETSAGVAASDPPAPKSDAPFLDKIRAMSSKPARENGIATDRRSPEKSKGGKVPVANSSPVSDNGKTTMSNESVPKSNSAERNDKTKEALVSVGPLKFRQEDIDSIVDGIDYNRALRGKIVRESGGEDKMSKEARRRFDESYQGARRFILRMVREANQAGGEVAGIPKVWEDRLDGYDMPQGPDLPPELEKGKAQGGIQEHSQPAEEILEGEMADGSDMLEGKPSAASHAGWSSEEGALGSIAGAIREDLRVESRGATPKKSEKPAAQKEAVAGDDGEEVSERLREALRRREERAREAKSAEAKASAENITVENAMDNPEFKRFMLAYFPDGETGELTDERMTAHSESFKKYQQTVAELSNIIIELEKERGIVQVDDEFKKEVFESFNDYLLEHARNQPALIENLRLSMRALTESGPRITEKEKVLADLGPRDALIAKRDQLKEAVEKRKGLLNQYDGGVMQSFLKGFQAGFARKLEAPSMQPYVKGENGELGIQMAQSKEKIGLFGRIMRGLRSGKEARAVAQTAKSGLEEGGFKKLTDAIDGGALDNLEEKIKTLDDAERQKAVAAEMFTGARSLIFDQMGELSGLVGRLRQRTRDSLRKMVSGDGDVDTLQSYFDSLEQASKRLSQDNIPYVDAASLEKTKDGVDALIELEFEKRIQAVLAEGLAQDAPFAGLQAMLAEYAGREKLGSKHGKEVRDFFKGAIRDYLKKNKDVPATKKLILNRIMVTLEGSKPAQPVEPKITSGEGDIEVEAIPEEVPAKEAREKRSTKEKKELVTKIPIPGDSVIIRRVFKDKATGEAQYEDLKNFRIDAFDYPNKKKGLAPRPGDKMKVSGSYDEVVDGKKVRHLNQVKYITFAQYKRWNTKSKEA